MSSNEETCIDIFDATNQIEVVRKCLSSNENIDPSIICENAGIDIILAGVIGSLSCHVEALMNMEALNSAKDAT